MDPNAALQTIVQLANKIQIDSDRGQVNPHDAVELAETVNGLHSWICRGGFLPNAWRMN